MSLEHSDNLQLDREGLSLSVAYWVKCGEGQMESAFGNLPHLQFLLFPQDPLLKKSGLKSEVFQFFPVL